MTSNQSIFMHGAGNRFLVHVGDDTAQQLMKSIGSADGILIVQEDASADANMKIVNADGSEAEQCGNGLRCVALHLVRSKLVEHNYLTIRTLSGVNKCVVREGCNEVEVTLCVPKVEVIEVPDFPNLVFVDMGNPNAVYWTEEDPEEVRNALGKSISDHPLFSEGMNVHFARRTGEQYAECASWERGVGATLASGTGGASVFVASKAKGPFYVSSLGGTLTCDCNEQGEVVVAGPACYE